MLQKRLEDGATLLRKTPRLFKFLEFHRGLQCVLSGNPVLLLATGRTGHKGKPPGRRRLGGLWENLLDLSHNLYPVDTIALLHIKSA